MSLALGLAIVAAFRVAERNDCDIAEELGKLLEPISALDKTAEAVFSALMAASVDETCSTSMRKALLIGFLGLQNVDETLYSPFVGVVRNTTEAAMEALAELAATKRHVANMEWLPRALRQLRGVTQCWAVISRYADQWLRRYSMEPSISVFSTIQDEGREKFEQKVTEEAEKLKKKLAALTDIERAFLAAKMVEVSDDPAPLQREAFELLAGGPLASFAEALVACAFSMALHSGFHAPFDEYRALVRFNRKDWPETQTKLLEAASFLSGSDVSITGKWALVQLLRAISREKDGQETHRLVEELTADYKKFVSWRLIEDYCATDPCNPASERPANIEDTATNRVSRTWKCGISLHLTKVIPHTVPHPQIIVKRDSGKIP